MTEDHANLPPVGGRIHPRNELPEENLTGIRPAPSQSSAKLDFRVTCRQHSTSQFLIDNLNGFTTKPFTLSSPAACPPWRVAGAVEGSEPACHNQAKRAKDLLFA